MKKLVLVALCAVIVLSGCADSKTIEGTTYRPYGIFNEDRCKNEKVEYEVSGWAVFSGIVFSEFLFIPTIYTFGYHLWEPVDKKGQQNEQLKGVVGGTFEIIDTFKQY